jgi:hypothetical protein
MVVICRRDTSIGIGTQSLETSGSTWPLASGARSTLPLVRWERQWPDSEALLGHGYWLAERLLRLRLRLLRLRLRLLRLRLRLRLLRWE